MSSSSTQPSEPTDTEAEIRRERSRCVMLVGNLMLYVDAAAAADGDEVNIVGHFLQRVINQIKNGEGEPPEFTAELVE